MIGFGKRRIETTQATKAGCHCHFSDRQVGFGQQLLGKQQALGGMHGHRRRPQVLNKQATQLSRTDVHALGQLLQ